MTLPGPWTLTPCLHLSVLLAAVSSSKHLTGHASLHVHTTVSVTETLALLVGRCGTVYQSIYHPCDRKLATDGLTGY